MQIFDHVSITVDDLAGAAPFYDAIMHSLGIEKVYQHAHAIGYGLRNDANDDAHSYFSLYESPTMTSDDRRHWCFRAASREAVRQFHRAGLAHGGKDGGPPGLRVQYHPHYYAAFLVDPSGNRVEAVYHRVD